CNQADRDRATSAPGVAFASIRLGPASNFDEHLRDLRPRRRARGPMRRQLLVVIVVVLALCVPGATRPARADTTVDQMLVDIGLSADERQQVMNGEFVTTRLARVSERDLPVALIVFVVTTSPDALARQIMTGDFITNDPQVQTYGRF